jgi:hypothetical protein
VQQLTICTVPPARTVQEEDPGWHGRTLVVR